MKHLTIINHILCLDGSLGNAWGDVLRTWTCDCSPFFPPFANLFQNRSLSFCPFVRQNDCREGKPNVDKKWRYYLKKRKNYTDNLLWFMGCTSSQCVGRSLVFSPQVSCVYVKKGLFAQLMINHSEEIWLEALKIEQRHPRSVILQLQQSSLRSFAVCCKIGFKE